VLDDEEFINLWKFTVKYLRDTKGVHNFIYAISPQMDSAKTVDDFYFRWPGDEWVDFVGMDCYQGINNAVFVTNLKAISKVSLAKLKPCGVTETGVEGFTATDCWTNEHPCSADGTPCEHGGDVAQQVRPDGERDALFLGVPRAPFGA